ncbi:MAG: SGNH/GDSL hydrolase family protein [Leptospiraceae bacterium]|nr:SGNH/GDSL hydrolase family protein [Leptospiraceae bacterium]MCP5511057.1 SGNH/GDSL hydrolase family protein [Leptospiraceae bacterium]
MELFFQSGIYTSFLKKNSYAANINRITNHIIAQKENHNPDILVLGTSVAYQGLSMRILQNGLDKHNLKIQSSAIPGSELIVQELASKKVLKNFDKVKLLIYVAEITMPWVSQTEYALPTLAMIAEFPISEILQTLPHHKYTSGFKIPVWNKEFRTSYGFSDMSYLFFKTIAYRRDLNDFFLDPGKRIKHFSRSINNPNQNFYDFENDHPERMSSYGMKDLQDCVSKTIDYAQPPFPENSNEDHKKAILDTCLLSIQTINLLEPTKTAASADTDSTRLYFSRLKFVLQPYLDRDIKVLVVYAPYSHLMGKIGGPEKLEVWNRETKKLVGDHFTSVDFQDLFANEDSNEFCYDTIHLNQFGMERFSNALSKYLDENLNSILEK